MSINTHLGRCVSKLHKYMMCFIYYMIMLIIVTLVILVWYEMNENETF